MDVNRKGKIIRKKRHRHKNINPENYIYIKLVNKILFLRQIIVNIKI